MTLFYGTPIYDDWGFKTVFFSAFLITSAIIIIVLISENDKPVEFSKYSIGACIAVGICGLAIAFNVILASPSFLLDGKQYDTKKIVEDNNLKVETIPYYEELNEKPWVLKAKHKGYLSKNGIEPGVVYIIEWKSGYGDKITKAFVYEDKESTPDPHVNDYQDYKYEDNTVSEND